MSLIFINVAGHLGQDPETRFTPSGQKVTTMSVATTIKRAGKEKTIWWRVTMWGDRFDKKLAYLKKGSSVMVWGEMGFPEYQDKEGNLKPSYEIIAEHVSFSPFGNKTERPAGGDESGAEPAYSSANASFASHQGYGSGTQTASRFSPKSNNSTDGDGFGQFSEDDIPF